VASKTPLALYGGEPGVMQSGDTIPTSVIPALPESQVTGLVTDLASKSPLAGSSSIVTLGSITTGVWQATVIGSAYIGDLSATYSLKAGNTSLVTVGTIATGTWQATAIDATHGGTGQTAVALGDLLYGSATNVWSRLAANATATRKFLRQVSGAAPAWDTITTTDLPVGAVIQSVTTTLTGAVTGSGNFNFSDSFPSIAGSTAGSLYSGFDIAITGLKSTNKFLIRLNFWGGLSTAGDLAFGIFRDSEDNPLAMGTQYVGGANELVTCSLQFEVLCGTGAKTFHVRIGGAGGRTFTLNGSASARYYGGLACSSMNIQEIVT
jgi:hypothetical protein